jgi:SAM-dependent methyltransferase
VNEQSKAAKRRYDDGAFHSRYFVGHGIDIGGKPDPLGQYVGVFARMQSVRTWDLDDGDAQSLAGVADDSLDFVHSSHCLEHMVDVAEAMWNWIRVLKPAGYIIVTVPDEDLYEQGNWPSRFNTDHKWTFTLAKTSSWSPRSINVIDLAKTCADRLELERLVLHRDFYRAGLQERSADQTLTPVAECAIEMISRKRVPPATA